jgi:hypothetical protein
MSRSLLLPECWFYGSETWSRPQGTGGVIRGAVHGLADPSTPLWVVGASRFGGQVAKTIHISTAPE